MQNGRFVNTFDQSGEDSAGSALHKGLHAKSAGITNGLNSACGRDQALRRDDISEYGCPANT